MTTRVHRFEVTKNGKKVSALFRGSLEFRCPKENEQLARDRIVGIDTESLRKNDRLRTLLVPLHFHDGPDLIETPSGTGMLSLLCRKLLDRFGEFEARPSETVQRDKGSRRKRKGDKPDGRDGRRSMPEPCLGVFFNLPYDLGRLFDDLTHGLKAIGSGASSYRIQLDGGLELEVDRLHLGSSSSFKFLVRARAERRIAQVLGIDMVAYWKRSLEATAQAVGIDGKIDIETEVPGIFEKDFSLLKPEEWERFKAYANIDAERTRSIYLATVELLVGIDPRVLNRAGVIPQSAPGAACKIMFAQAFEQHPGLKSWKRYTPHADQLGADAYFGGRAFCAEPGTHENIASVDRKSAYPYAEALLPDPVTVEMWAIRAEGNRLLRELDETVDDDGVVSFSERHTYACGSSHGFDVNRWRGKFGVLVVDGEALDPVYPAFRKHDDGRLRYVYGSFRGLPVTIPELVIGVITGSLRIDRVHRGYVAVGPSDKSFMRAGVRKFYEIKDAEDKAGRKGSPLYELAKLLLNSPYGKLIETQRTDFLTPVPKVICPRFKARNRFAASVARVFASRGDCELDRLYWGDSDEQKKAARAFFEDSAKEFSEEQREGQAVQAYVNALESVEAEVDPGPSELLADYVEATHPYKAGAYFFPFYAAAITGLTSATLGCLARCVRAVAGDTDAVFFRLEPDQTVDSHPGFKRFYELMTEAGYPSPRVVDGQIVDGIPGLGNLGVWELESEERGVGVFIRPKVYSIRYPSGKHKQALHGFAKFTTPEAEDARTDYTVPKKERETKARTILRSAYHVALDALLAGSSYEYKSRRAPRRLREALKTGKPVGEFVSKVVQIRNEQNPHTVLVHGVVHWMNCWLGLPSALSRWRVISGRQSGRQARAGPTPVAAAPNRSAAE